MTQRALSEAAALSDPAESSAGHELAGKELEGLRPYELPDLDDSCAPIDAPRIDPHRSADVDVQIVLGRTRMHLEDVLKLRKGAVVPFDARAGDPVEIYADGRLVGRGEMLVLDDCFCVRVVEVVTDAGLEAA
ncbi:MAG: FliM/FliN family flagellar motor switch protein [Planctomycetia bacterium]|nr:FliM/FliN family flagellar motor switch protein [Planctomycetia bacterium]